MQPQAQLTSFTINVNKMIDAIEIMGNGCEYVASKITKYTSEWKMLPTVPNRQHHTVMIVGS